MTISRAGCRAIAVGALACLTGVAVSGQDPTDGFESQLRSKVANAGYKYDAPGLARALKDHDTTVAVTAAGFLSRFPPTAESMAALRVAAEERYEPLVSRPRERSSNSRYPAGSQARSRVTRNARTCLPDRARWDTRPGRTKRRSACGQSRAPRGRQLDRRRSRERRAFPRLD